MLTTRARGINSDKSDLRAQIFLKEDMPMIWDEILPFIERSVAGSHGQTSVDQVQGMIACGEAFPFVTFRKDRVEAVLIATVVDYAGYRAARILACAGMRLADAMQHFDLLQSWALTCGCREIEGWCKQSTARLVKRFGFQTKKVLVSYDLRSKLQ